MLYKIGDVAQLLGISTEGLRYYEECGIVTPKKREGSSFRYYDAWDIHILVSARSFRSLGFSLKEISDIINSKESMDIPAMLDAKEKELEETILLNQNLLKRNAQIRTMFREYHSMEYQYRIENSPGIYWITTQDEYSLITSPAVCSLAHQWIIKAPFVFTCILLPKEELEKGGDKFSVGFGIDEKFADYLKIEQNDAVSYFPPRRCVVTTIPSSSDIIFSPAHLSGAMAYIHSQGLKLADDAFSMVFNFHKEGPTFKDVHCVWLPIAD